MPRSLDSEGLAGESPPPTSGAIRRKGWLKRLVAAGLLAAALVMAFLWWQERAISKADAALERGDARYALYLVSKYLNQHPNDSRALAIQARSFVALGQVDEAIQVFDRVGPASMEDLRAFARAYMVRQEWSAALPLLIRALQMDPHHPDTLYETASCEVQLGRYPEAIEHAQRFAELPGNAPRGYVLIGSTYGYMRNNGAAAKWLKKALEEEPQGENLQISPADLFLRYGRVLMELGQPAEALEPLKQCVAREPIGEAFHLLGDAAAQLGQPENAQVAWEQAVKVEPDNHLARASLANAALLNGDGKESLRWLEPIAEGSLTASVAYQFQRTYTLLGNEAEAAKWQQKTAELRREQEILSTIDNFLISQPDSFWARAARAHRFAAEGNWTEAESLVATLIEEQPGEPFVIELADAIRRKSRLPEITRIPVIRY